MCCTTRTGFHFIAAVDLAGGGHGICGDQAYCILLRVLWLNLPAGHKNADQHLRGTSLCK